MVLHSTVSIAKTGTNSLRTTIPNGIVEFLNIYPGEKISWEMKLRNRKKYVLVIPMGKVVKLRDLKSITRRR